MISPCEQAERIQALRGLVERLCASDLTLTEAKVLRGRLSDLLERDRPSVALLDRGNPQGPGSTSR